MQKHTEHKEYKKEQIRQLILLLTSDEPVAGEKWTEIEYLLLSERYAEEVSEALEEVWVASGRKINLPEYIQKQKQVTLTGIARKCEDFPVKPTVQTVKRHPLRRRMILRVAAVLLPLMVLGASLAWWMNGGFDFFTGGNVLAETIIIEASDGGRVVNLPDGSRVRLQEGSSLEYDSGFSVRRAVTLKGDAFFTVTKMNGQSFEVSYNDMSVQVLGTEFNLCSRGSTTEVTLCSGSVKVVSPDFDVLLEPCQQLVTHNGEADYEIAQLSEEEIARLLKGRLQFRGTPLQTALEQTGLFFQVEIDMGHLSYDQPVWLTFDANDKLEDVLFMLQMITENAFGYEIEGERITVSDR